ncbi:MAG: hypothetical protein MUC35_05950 [Candidatus Margulisbacteria bacterium]|jgi:hypothetical protein|nr:hypothetical protein [Candidatus Margulisiibacteriota bacterium]
MSELALTSGFSGAKEYALQAKLALGQQKPQEQQSLTDKSAAATRESQLKWVEDNSGADFKAVVPGLDDSTSLLASATTTVGGKLDSAKPATMREELVNRFKKAYVGAYGNMFSHNRLLARVSEWLVGNVMDQLAHFGVSAEELSDLRSQVRADQIDQNHTAMRQTIYDETMHEILA